MPQLLPRSFSFSGLSYSADWIGPGGRLVWATLIVTISLLWIMMLMKRPAVKNKIFGPGIFLVGTGIGVSMVTIGRTVLHNTLTGNTLIPFGYIIAWLSFLGGLWIIIMSIRFEPIQLRVSRLLHVVITLAILLVFYVIGGFVHSVTLLMAWLMVLTFLTSISLWILSLPRRVENATWGEAVVGGLASFALMAMVFAVIPHEFITFANSYLAWTKDVKLSAGGEFFIQTWLHGNFWTSHTRIIPFELNMEIVQDNATSAIYVIMVIVTIRLFAAWQKRNEPIETSVIDEKSEQKKSRFGRPLRALRTSKA